MSQHSSSDLSISEDAAEVLSVYATGKRSKKSEIRKLLKPFIDTLGVTSKEELVQYRKSIIAVIAKIELESEVLQVIGGRWKKTGKTTRSERDIFFAKDIEAMNDFELAIRKSAQKKMSEEWSYLLRLWFNTVSSTYACSCTM